MNCALERKTLIEELTSYPVDTGWAGLNIKSTINDLAYSSFTVKYNNLILLFNKAYY